MSLYEFQDHPLVSKLNEKLSSCRKCKNCNTTGGPFLSEMTNKIDCLFIAQNPGKSWFNKSVDINEIIPFGLQKPNPYGRFFAEFSEKFERKFSQKFTFYVTNVIKCATEDNQVKDLEMIDNCSKYLNIEIEYFLRENPNLFIIALGKVSAEETNNIKVDIPIYTCYHPGYLNRGGTARVKEAVQDLFDMIF